MSTHIATVIRVLVEYYRLVVVTYSQQTVQRDHQNKTLPKMYARC